MIRYKLLLVLLLFVIVSSVFTACNNSKSNTDTNVNTKASDAKNLQNINTVDNTNKESEYSSINYNIIKKAIVNGNNITQKEVGLSQEEYLKGIYKDGDIIYVSDESIFLDYDSSLYCYEADHNRQKYVFKEMIPIYSSEKKLKTGIKDDGTIINGLDIIQWDKSSYGLLRIVNAFDNISYFQANQDEYYDKIYRVLLDEKKSYEIDINTDNIVNTLLMDEKELRTPKVTLIALPNQKTLYHVFVMGNHADKMTSYWAVCNKDNSINFSFQTRYFDNITNVHVQPDGRYLIFSYSQTPGYPQLLDIEEKEVYPLFQQESEIYHSAVTFLSWINSEQICVGLADVDRTVCIISVNDVKNN
ncbi:UNVERIFIED_CONTAM: hypothetical protein Cloal_4145 [Acetivibrio alkalicellulosi]